jgi:hypothetical protein
MKIKKKMKNWMKNINNKYKKLFQSMKKIKKYWFRIIKMRMKD